MTTYYVNSITGNDASADPTNPATPLLTADAANALINGAGGAGFGLGATVKFQDVGPHTITAVIGTIGYPQGITLEGPDTWVGGVYQWAIIDAAGAVSDCVRTNKWWTLRGLWLKNATGSGLYPNTTGSTRVYRCRASGNGAEGFYSRMGTAGQVIEYDWCIAHDNGTYGLYTYGAVAACAITMRNCMAYRNGGNGIYAIGVGSTTALIENSGAYGNGTSPGAVAAIRSSDTVLNCWALDNATQYGIYANVAHDYCCSHSSNPATYHTTANFTGPPGTGSFETLPGLVNAAGDDFHPSVGSNLFGAGSAAATLTVDLDGVAYALPYPIGPYVGIFDLSSAGGNTGSVSVALTFSEALDLTNPDLTDDTLYALTAPLGTVTHTVTAASASGSTVTLTVTPALYAHQLYRVTVPATLTAASGALINPATLTADFVTGATAQLDSGNPWAATLDGTQILDPPLEMVPATPGSVEGKLSLAVWMSLFSDRVAEDGDLLPVTTGDPVYRGGWWADTYSDDGSRFGSRLWLLSRSGVTDETARLVEEYSAEALAWMVSDGIAYRVDTEAQSNGLDTVSLIVRLYRQGADPLVVSYDDLWAEWEV